MDNATNTFAADFHTITDMMFEIADRLIIANGVESAKTINLIETNMEFALSCGVSEDAYLDLFYQIYNAAK